jgi:hypothetical protein
MRLSIIATKREIDVHLAPIYPPIPIRSFDWAAIDDLTYDSLGGPVGRGSTEQEAINDLLEMLSCD